MPKRTADETRGIEDFLEPHFGVGFKPGTISKGEEKVLAAIMAYVAEKFAGMRYVLGLAIDFSLLAQQLSNHDPSGKAARLKWDKEDIFKQYQLITERAGKTANTLTLKWTTQIVGIRKFEESLAVLFGELNRPGYPSAYVYNTGQWISVEVKDHGLSAQNVSNEVGEFLDKVQKNKVMGLAFVLDADSAAIAEMEKHGVRCVRQGDVLWIVGQWDWRKQDAAVNGLLHYLAHVEQNPDAVERLLKFISQKDSTHDSLAYYRPSNPPSK